MCIFGEQACARGEPECSCREPDCACRESGMYIYVGNQVCTISNTSISRQGSAICSYEKRKFKTGTFSCSYFDVTHIWFPIDLFLYVEDFRLLTSPDFLAGGLPDRRPRRHPGTAQGRAPHSLQPFCFTISAYLSYYPPPPLPAYCEELRKPHRTATGTSASRRRYPTPSLQRSSRRRSSRARQSAHSPSKTVIRWG